MKTGFVATASVLVISAVVTAAVVTVVLLGVGEAQGSLAGVKGEEGLQLVEGCVEDALLAVWNDSSWAGGILDHPAGSCEVTLTSGNPNWDMTVAAATGDYRRRVRVQFTRGTSITMTSWEEI